MTDKAKQLDDDLREVIERGCAAIQKGDAPDAIAAYLWSHVGPRLAGVEAERDALLTGKLPTDDHPIARAEEAEARAERAEANAEKAIDLAESAASLSVALTVQRDSLRERAEQAEQRAASMREALKWIAADTADCASSDPAAIVDTVHGIATSTLAEPPKSYKVGLNTFTSQPPTDVEEAKSIEDPIAQGRCPECGTLAGIWHKLGCSRDPERKDPAPQQPPSSTRADSPRQERGEPGVDVPGARPEISEELRHAVAAFDRAHTENDRALKAKPLAHVLASVRPPAPALSDEEREWLKRIAAWLDSHQSLRTDLDATFLRDLASQEHRGEEQGKLQAERERADRLEVENAELEDANRSLAKMRDAALEGDLAAADPSPGEVGRSNDSEREEELEDEIEALKEKLRRVDEARKDLIREKELGTWLEGQIAEIEVEGVGRLRERIADEALKLFTEALPRGIHRNNAEEHARGYVNRLVDAAFPGPSDSQGDQGGDEG